MNLYESPQARSRRKLASDEARRMSRRRILVADDDAALCALIEAALRKAEYEIVLCKDAESALDAIRSEGAFDVVVCDFMLPGITGIDLIERIRDGLQTPDVPVIMISGHTNYSIGLHASRSGADYFLPKPFTIAQLRDTVAKAVRRAEKAGAISIV